MLSVNKSFNFGFQSLILSSHHNLKMFLKKVYDNSVEYTRIFKFSTRARVHIEIAFLAYFSIEDMIQEQVNITHSRELYLLATQQSFNYRPCDLKQKMKVAAVLTILIDNM